ncbi:hypothetical protein [Providencia alcalifaciens]|uniref:hypothetical protein n=1 Tax=Providencia alcalifaciens TaxID=126385 RepID=UPI0003E241BB|nr:hypothetical protein [Providencia alcalifaciens]ETT01252.1 hypothetical protein HMPREF1568_3386 [Providencia alcalifaciens PAL-3]EUC99067.1 hypothetical protein HMPREF1566_0788 [Providencia alcalifaciens PAL-1]
MKIAVHMFGHLRTFKRCAVKLKENLNNENLDSTFSLFIHTWNTIDTNTSELPDIFLEKEIIAHYDFFSEINILIEKQKDIIMTFPKDQFFGIRCMHYSLSKSISLYLNKNKFDYDLHLIIRPDILLESKLCLSNFESAFDRNKDLYTALYIHEHIKSLNFNNILGGIDILFIVRPSIISKMINITNTPNIYKPHKSGRLGEPQFINFLEVMNIRWSFLNFIGGNDWRILRKRSNTKKYIFYTLSQLKSLMRNIYYICRNIIRGC